MSTLPLNRFSLFPGFADRTPPKARLVLRVGVTGHRLNKLSPDDIANLAPTVRTQLETVWKCLREHHAAHLDLFHSDPPVLRVVSPLAEGADQIVARAGLELGCELHALLPFERNDYLATFSEKARIGSPSAVVEFERLLQKATAVFSLDGALANRDRAFEFLGKLLVKQVDLLIAIWDGQSAAGPGGTERVVRNALAQGVPVIWLNPRKPGEPRWLTAAADITLPGVPATELCKGINGLLRLPQEELRDAADAGAKEQIQDRSTAFTDDYLKEFQPERDFLGGYWTAFRNELNGEEVKLTSEVEDFVDRTKREWHQDLEDFKSRADRLNSPAANDLINEVQRIDQVLLPHYAWANQLALHYGNRYRSAFLLNYVLSALAVVLCLLIVAFGWMGHGDAQAAWVSSVRVVLALGECACIGLITVNTYRGRWGRWHERWIDYRMLAEGLRQFRALAPLGGWSLQPPVPEHLARYGDPRSTWMAWHLRNIIRETGLPDWRLGSAHLNAYQDYFATNLIEDQIRFHETTVRRLETARHKLHHFGDRLFLFTGVLCVGHLTAVTGFWHPPDMMENWMTALLAILPAIGAALFGIRSQGEFQRVAKRSRGMQEELTRYGKEFVRLQKVSADARTTLETATACSQLMVREVLDWRIVFVDHPLDLPA